tara:strand:+ start:5669 stop:5800 length:132 start_codon:yes stop_codon:yes gene_type:complete
MTGAADACGRACATTERGVKPANIDEVPWPLALALLGLEGGAE